MLTRIAMSISSCAFLCVCAYSKTMQRPPPPTPTETLTAVNAELARIYRETASVYAKALTSHTGRPHGVAVSRRWLRVYEAQPAGGRSVVLFVDSTTGVAHKPDGWKRAGRALGSIFDVADGMIVNGRVATGERRSA